jgi:ankyrin repeat protein
LVRTLLEAGADINIVTNDDQTPLYIAAQQGQMAVARVLIQAGADVNAATNDGRTPLYMATGLGREPVVRVAGRSGRGCGQGK